MPTGVGTDASTGAAGLNHGTAPLSLREKLALTRRIGRRLWRRLRARFPGSEAGAALDVQSRGAVCGDGGDWFAERGGAAGVLGAARGMEADQFRGHVYQKSDRGVVGHLFTVASSLDSMVLGESQILGQVARGV